MKRWTRQQAVWAAFCGLLFVVGCWSVVASQEPVIYRLATRGEHVLYNPVLLRLVYEETERCLGVDGDVNRVEWRVAEAIWNATGGYWVDGFWLDRMATEGRNIIVLSVQARYDPNVISHEALHDITGLMDGDSIFEAARRKCEINYREGRDGEMRVGFIKIPGG